MRLHLSLSSKVLILVAVPLLIQLLLFGWLAALQNNAESELAAANHARDIADATNALSKDIAEGISTFSVGHSLSDFSDLQKYRKVITAFRNDCDRLRQVAADKPDLLAAVNNSQKQTEEALASLLQLFKNMRNEGKDAHSIAHDIWVHFHSIMLNLDYQKIVAMGRAESEVAAQSSQTQVRIRRQIRTVLLAGSLMTTSFSLLLAIYLTKSITARLAKLSDNTVRLATDMPLNPRLEGSDDIAKLDKVFHKMAEEIKEASRRERAVTDNARDFICSMDKDFRVLKTNPAVTSLLGYSQQDIVGRRFVDVIDSHDAPRALEYFELLKKQDSNQPLELQLRRSDGTAIDALWSARWSQQEKTLFSVIHDISERRQSERLREDVIAMVTHDLRTPLSTISNIIQLMSDGPIGVADETQSLYLKPAAHNVQRMMQLINDLLDSERVKSQAMILEVQDVSLSKCMQNCEQSLRAIAADLGIELSFAPTELIVKADESMVERILVNLVANGIKFSPKGACVSVSATADGSFAHVVVSDNGPGIPADQLQTVFERFRRGPSRVAAKLASSGLGLFICKSLVELHRGRIWAQTEVGKGSQFHFTLPLADRQEPGL
jgi:PAS domain S-box-containing protein